MSTDHIMSTRPSNARVVISVNTSWNIYNFRAGLIKALLARGSEVVALAPRDAFTDRLESMGCRFVPIAMDSKGTNPVRDLAIAVNYYRQLRAIRPDIYLGYTIKPNVYGSLAAHLLNIPTINNVSGLGTAFLNPGPLQRVVEVLYRTAFSRSRRVFFQNRDDRDLFLKRWLVREAQTGLLPGSGIDLTRFSPEPSTAAPSGEPVRFLFIGRVLFDKGVGEYVEAARMLRAEGLQARFSILGFMDVVNRTAVDRPTMESWIAEGLIEYLGETDDVRPHIVQADCVVLPSYREGTPRTLLEAAALARPLIATDVPGCREVVDEGRTGFLCRVKDAADLARCMRQISLMPKERRNLMGLAGRQKMEKQFDEGIVVNAYLSEIDHILKERHSRRPSDAEAISSRH